MSKATIAISAIIQRMKLGAGDIQLYNAVLSVPENSKIMKESMTKKKKKNLQLTYLSLIQIRRYTRTG